MVLNYDLLAQWELIVGLGVLFTLSMTYAYKVFYMSIVNNENNVKNKVREDISAKVKSFDKIVSKQGDLEFATQVAMIAKFNEIVTSSKSIFERELLFSAVGVILAGLFFVVWSENRSTIFVIGAVVLGFHLLSLNTLRERHEKVGKFLNNENLRDILKDWPNV